jgi:hypothetical protein
MERVRGVAEFDLNFGGRSIRGHRPLRIHSVSIPVESKRPVKRGQLFPASLTSGGSFQATRSVKERPQGAGELAKSPFRQAGETAFLPAASYLKRDIEKRLTRLQLHT